MVRRCRHKRLSAFLVEDPDLFMGRTLCDIPLSSGGGYPRCLLYLRDGEEGWFGRQETHLRFYKSDIRRRRL